MFYRYIVLISLTLIMASCAKPAHSNLTIPFIKKEINMDTTSEEEVWMQAVNLNNLIAPWENDSPDQTKFKAYVSQDYFNFIFEVVDHSLVTIPFEKELSVAGGDRVELFFASDSSLTEYYCIEIDPKGNILDYSAENYRKFNDQWDFESIQVDTKITNKGYLVKGRISLTELEHLGISKSFFLGVFRADFKNSKTKEVSWYSWIKPRKSSPDFHIPSAFGKASLKK